MSTAEDADEDASLLTRLSDDFLVCPRCRRRYSEPRLLTCLHAVCRDCLDALRAAAVARQRYRLSFVSLECPVCRRLTDVTPGVERLPADSVRARLLEVVSLAEAAASAPAAADSTVVSCDLCSHSSASLLRHRPATARCLDCGKLLCPACRQRHRRVRVTSDHELVDLDRQTAFNCDRHPRELVRFYCTSCQVPVCIGCTFSNAHNAHTVLKFKDAAHQRAAELAEYSRLCSEKLQQLASALQLARSLESHVTATEAAIREAAVQQSAAIRAAQKALLDELGDFYDCCTGLVSGRHEIAAALRDLTEVSSFGELVQCHKYSESLLLASLVSSTLSRYADFQPQEVPLRLRRYRLLFEPAAGQSHALLGSLEKQRLTDSCGSMFSNCSSSSSTDVSSLGSEYVTAPCDEPERSFFTYDNSTLRSSVCRSLTTDTLVSPVADAECQTDFCLVVNLLGFALISLHCSEAAADTAISEATATTEAAPQLLALCQSETPACARVCDFLDPSSALHATAERSSVARTPLQVGLCTVQSSLHAAEPAVPPPETQPQPPSRWATSSGVSADQQPFEVRVCSVMFSSMESNEFDELELVRPTQLRDIGCQSCCEPAAHASRPACTQTPHLPARRDLVASGTQTSALALFSRDAQARPDTEDRWSQTQRHRGDQQLLRCPARLDKSTQWESSVGAALTSQHLYRSGRIVKVVGSTASSTASSVCDRLALSPRSPRRIDASTATAATEAEAAEPRLQRLTQSLAQKARPAAPGCAFATAVAAPKSEETSLDRLKNFCARLRQRRSGLAKQKIVVLMDRRP